MAFFFFFFFFFPKPNLHVRVSNSSSGARTRERKKTRRRTRAYVLASPLAQRDGISLAGKPSGECSRPHPVRRCISGPEWKADGIGAGLRDICLSATWLAPGVVEDRSFFFFLFRMVQFSKRRLAPLRRDDVPFSDSVYTTAGPNQDARLDRRRLYLHLITVKMQGCVLCVLPIDTKFSPATLPQRKPCKRK